jgi:hypothetical protein
LKKTTIVISSEPSYFDCIFTSKEQLIKWVGKIKEIQPGILLKGDTQVLDSMIYDSIPDPHNDRGPFRVEIQQHQLLPYSGPAQLRFEVMEPQGIYLIDVFTEARGRVTPIVRWQIDHLRGYGASESVLKVETGRKTPTGPGCFVFKTPQAENIRHIIHHWASEIARRRTVQPSHTPAATTTYESVTPPPIHPSSSMRRNDAPSQGNPAYQSLLFSGSKDSSTNSTYQALNPSTMGSPQQPPPILPKGTSTTPPVESPYQPLSPTTMTTESKYTAINLA